MRPRLPLPPSVARRLAMLALLGLALVLLAVGAAMGVLEQRSTRALVVSAVAEQVQSMVAVADTADQINRGMVLRAYASFRRNFDHQPQVDESTGEMQSGGSVVNDDFLAVDRFTKETAGVAMVFARKGDAMVCISSSTRTESGERSLDIPFDAHHPAYATIMAGQPYTGYARLFGKSYLTRYEPLKAADGHVIGAFGIGNDVSLQEWVLEQQVAKVKIFDTGGMYYLDANGAPSDFRFLVHPTAKGKKVLATAPAAASFLEALAQAPDGHVHEAYPLLDETTGARWAVMRKTQSGSGWLVAEVSEAESMRSYWRNMTIIGSLLVATALLLGTGLFYLVRRTVSAPLGELTKAVTLVAQGDLTQSFASRRRDEIGTLVSGVEHLRKSYQLALDKVRTTSEGIRIASMEIATGNQDLSNRTEHTAGNLQSTASSMAQLMHTVQRSEDAARQANQLAASAVQVAQRGGAAVSDVVATMGEITQSSHKIADITGVIDGIAFQTNILALNAAVEAARAGEQGRGFAVVAAEVRNLAHRSAEAAKAIKLLIDASVERVASGSLQVQQAGDTMQEIVGSVQRVNHIISEIAATAAAQSSDISRVNAAVVELDQLTQQNAALVEQSTAASESLHDQANTLAQAVVAFKLQTTPALPL
ncbi:methyl-accepting chemotaxis protein [Rhodoferax saidenbachensis]|uniref:Methyl-accepting chemotaxis protein-2 (Aspartate sensor receptor) n=1 Tax=Rhodoferax saidenbachensis TaxID=1484693 RepID=A0ABU1ZMD2_9BURK|nr:methyl-accepting chemotaxis protein [Rhodoferax saidenbachensis]MDR7306707.1 methyl-accepting chemotaxis protein-2 (aspartate sensor receptor) [Rhodoferax saidenbachensis]